MALVRLNLSESERGRSVFANGPNGEKLGRLDLNTGRVWIEDSRAGNDVATKLVAWAAQNSEKLAPTDASRTPRDPSAPWDDLALRKPGQGLEHPLEQERSRLRARSLRWYYADKLLMGDEGWAGPWIRGIKGERRIAKVLAKVAKRSDWRVLHSIPLPGGGDIDHLLIGADGVIAINTKHHPKAQISLTPRAVYIRGNRTEYLQDARDGAVKVSRILSAALGSPVEVTPCVAIVSGPVFRSKYATHGYPSDVLVGTEWNLPRVLWDADKRLTAEAVEQIYGIARRSTTWR